MINLVNNISSFIHNFAAPCRGGGFLGFPTWYKYLDGNYSRLERGQEAICTPVLSGINDVWLIMFAVVEILLRVAMILAVFFVLYGGIQYIGSRGNAEKVTNAKNTVIDALIGLIIAIAATAVINYIGTRFN